MIHTKRKINTSSLYVHFMQNKEKIYPTLLHRGFTQAIR